MKNVVVLILMLFLLAMGKSNEESIQIYRSEHLKIVKLSESTFVHVSYLETNDFGKVACNGMIIVDKGEAIVFDTPTNSEAANELITWLEQTMECKPIAVVATHFHIDCLGSIETFHKAGIPSHASNKTIEFAKVSGYSVPKSGFEDQLELSVGDKTVYNKFFGEGHTQDNIVVYEPVEKVVFGGCLIKSIGAGKGNLEDANVNEWSKTVQKIKTTYPNVEIVIPGHGKVGKSGLFDYTIALFSK